MHKKPAVQAAGFYFRLPEDLLLDELAALLLDELPLLRTVDRELLPDDLAVPTDDREVEPERFTVDLFPELVPDERFTVDVRD